MQGMSPFPLCFMTNPGSLLSSQMSRAGLCMLTATPSPPSRARALLSPAYLSPAPPGKPSEGQYQQWQLLLQGCLRRAALFVVGKHGEEVAAKAGKGGCGDRWLCAQGAVPVCGRLHNSELLSPSQSRLDYCCGHLHDDNNLLPCMTLLVWGGHTASDLLTCFISSFYPLVLIWDFSGCNTPF